MGGASAIRGSFMRKVLGLSISAAAILATGLLPAAAFAAMTSPASIAADTPVTFTVANGGISISAPTATAALSDPAIGGTATGSLGVVEVTDAQGLDGGTWNVEASTSTFITGAGTTTPETIPITDVGYDPGAVGDMTITGTVTVTPTDVTIAGGGLTGDVTVVAASDIVGNDTVSWNPVITVLVPSTNVSGAYAGTITNSLA
jgi:hypothetical protein